MKRNALHSMSWPVALKALATRTVCLALLWWALSEGVWDHWQLPALTIAVATISSFRLWPPGAWRWHAGELVRFLPYFLWQSLRGGLDVSLRALRPSLPVHPGLIEYPLRLTDPAARVFFAWVVSLLPGTATVGLTTDHAIIHALDTKTLPITESLRDLEQRVAAMFGERWRASTDN